jgi:seryl-tRNA synthetase
MHDIRAIRADPAAFDAAMARRGLYDVAPPLLDLDAHRRAALTVEQDWQARNNATAREFGQRKRDGAETETLLAAIEHLKKEKSAIERVAGEAEHALQQALAKLPNALDPDVPDGADEKSNIELKQWGTRPGLQFQPRQHFELGEALGMMDFERAAKIAGSRFTVLRGPLARLERALGQFMLDLHTGEHGYEETRICSIPPMGGG